MAEVREYSGIIRATTRDGRSGFVALEPKIEGREYAVISPDTKGRIELMNGVGRLMTGVHVTGTAEIGSEALRAISVRAISMHPAE
jgi:hypothetical protein